MVDLAVQRLKQQDDPRRVRLGGKRRETVDTRRNAIILRRRDTVTGRHGEKADVRSHVDFQSVAYLIGELVVMCAIVEANLEWHVPIDDDELKTRVASVRPKIAWQKVDSSVADLG